MATPAVDYDALAKQAQGIDYDSLADAARTVDVSPEGRPVYRTTVTASPWDRAVDAFGEFTSMLQPTPGEPFEAKAEQIIRGIRDLPLYSANSLNNFYGSLSKGDMPGAAYHLAGVVPILGHMSQRISDDLKAGHYSEAAGHFMGILATAGLMWPDQPIDSLQSAVDTVKDIPNAVGTKTGDVILKLPPQAAKVLGRAAGGTTGAIVGGPIGAGWGASKGGQFGVTALDALQTAIKARREMAARVTAEDWWTQRNAEREAAEAQATANPPPSPPEFVPMTPPAIPAAARAPEFVPMTPPDIGPAEAPAAAAAPAVSEEALLRDQLTAKITKGEVKSWDKLPKSPQKDNIANAAAAYVQRPPAAAQAPNPSAPPAEAPTATQTPAAATPQPTVEELSRQINESPAQQGPQLVPKPEKTSEEFAASARSARWELAPKIGDYMLSKGFTSDQVANISQLPPAQLRAQGAMMARLAGIDKTPTPKGWDDIAAYMRGREMAGTAGRPMTAIERMSAQSELQAQAKQAKARKKAAAE